MAVGVFIWGREICGPHIFNHVTIISRYIQWADYLHTVQIKSIQACKPPPVSRRTRSNSGEVDCNAPFSRLMTIAVFKIHPLELLTCLSIERHVSEQQ